MTIVARAAAQENMLACLNGPRGLATGQCRGPPTVMKSALNPRLRRNEMALGEQQPVIAGVFHKSSAVFTSRCCKLVSDQFDDPVCQHGAAHGKLYAFGGQSGQIRQIWTWPPKSECQSR